MNVANRTGSTEHRMHSANLAKVGVDCSAKPKRAGAETQGRALIGAGLVGAGLAAICWCTPLLVRVSQAVGLNAWLAGVD